MAVTSKQIIDFLLANPGMSDAQIAASMQEFNVTPAQMATAVGLPVQEVQARYKEAAPSVYTAENVNKLADQILSQGTTEAWTGGLPPEKAALYMADELAKSGVTDITQVAKGDSGIINVMTGDKLVSGYGERTKDNLWSGSYEGKGNTAFGVNFDESGKPVFYTQGASSSTLKDDILKVAAVGALAFGIPGVTEGLLSGTAAGGAATLGTTGLTAAELAQLDIALGGVGGSTGATQLASALTTGAAVPTVTSLTGGSGVGTLGVTGANGAFLGEGVLSGVPASDLALANAPTAFELANAGASAFTPTVLPPVDTTGLLTTPVVPPAVTPPVVTPPAVTPPVVTPPAVAPPVVAPPVVAPPAVIPPVADLVKAGLTATQIAQLLATTAQTASGLLQQQTSKEAAQKAQAMIDAETAAAKQSAAFRPIGMTTRFGASQFGFDPKTGQLTSAGYTLSPAAKAAQDRFVKLAEQGIQQAEGAQKAFEPLQTGAQSLFTLGNKYLAQTPESVAENYLKSQMALLQPGRELELANLQNRLQQQGRGGLSVAQGGTLGATTPELQALFNARAQQEAQLAANAQREGQQNVLFGSGLLSQGAQTMGQYYGGQQAAYAPYTTALGQVQALETAAQQPLTMGAGLGQTAAQAGFNVGQLGLRGAGASVDLATGKAATTNPYSTLLSGFASNPAFANYFGNALSGTPSVTAMSAPATTFGTGTYYGNQDLGLFL
jgi:hypothetical protein